MFHKIFCYTFKYIQIFFISCFRIRNRTAVYSPSLTSRPSRAVTITLTSNALCRFTCFHIKEICMICRIIVTHDIFHRCFYMCPCFFFILFITCHLARPEKQRHIHKTIYYKSVIVLIAYFAPRLKELTFFVKTFHQIIRSQKCRTFTHFTACKLICRNARRAVQKAHIVMVGINMMFYSVKEVVHLTKCRLL